ncbi:hypothetical protein [Marinobacter panjinensis]|uniref:hypothetical protein n=1 Tax=Marinobacter panjinensis TaxID=2576384 RepID=UPI001D190E59|nr:hypothetical protein [Marinobacter panjinensis]MCR8914545.1 hypothetical protein [Marinobacter panjinensis]
MAGPRAELVIIGHHGGPDTITSQQVKDIYLNRSSRLAEVVLVTTGVNREGASAEGGLLGEQYEECGVIHPGQYRLSRLYPGG